MVHPGDILIKSIQLWGSSASTDEVTGPRFLVAEANGIASPDFR